MDRSQQVVPRRGMVLAVAMLTAFITAFTGSGLNLSIPGISGEFGTNADTVGWIVTGYMLVIAAFSVPAGRLADVTSRRRVLIIGTAAFCLLCLTLQFASSFPMTLVMRMLQGVSAAMILSTNQAVLLSVYPPNQKGKVLGYSIGAAYVSLSLGPVLGGFMNDHFGWRSIFLLAGAAGIAALVLELISVPARRNTEDVELDIGGSLLYIVSIVLTMHGLSNIAGGVFPICETAAGIAAGVVFIRHELAARHPVLNISLFRSNVGYTLSNIAALMNYSATFAISYLISIYLQVAVGYSSQTAGLILVSQTLVMAMLTPITGRLSDRFSPYHMSSLGMGFCAAGTLMFAFLGTDTRIGYIICALIVTGVGFALFSPTNTNAIMSCVDRSDYAVASSVVNTMRTVGQTLSMVIVTIIVAARLPHTQLVQASPGALAGVIRTAFVLFTGVCVVGIFISLKRKKEPQEES